MEGMKQSGIQWIGEIPSDWTLLKMKHFSYMKGRIGWQGLTADEFIEEGPYLITGTDFENGHVCWDRCYHISEKRYDEAVPIQVQVGDLLVTKDGTIGKLAYIDELPDKASLNSHLLVIRPIGEKYINRFMYWLLYSSVFQGYYEFESYGSTMDSLSQEKIGEFSFYAPSISEQKQIADFLDSECSQLDEIINTVQQQIDVLKAYKKSVITEAVTKGLVKHAEMKDSGVDWIGQVPKHWDTLRLKYVMDNYDYLRRPIEASERSQEGDVLILTMLIIYIQWYIQLLMKMEWFVLFLICRMTGFPVQVSSQPVRFIDFSMTYETAGFIFIIIAHKSITYFIK